MKKWKKVSSKHLIQDRWISVRSDECTMPNGNIVKPYYILEYPEWVNVVAITDEKQVVLVKQYRHGLEKIMLELPSGTVDKADDSPLSTVKRELEEETGYICREYIELGSLSPNPANHTNLVHCYLGIGATLTGKVSLDDTEEITVELVDLNRLVDMMVRGEIMEAMHVASIFLSLEKLKQF